MHGLETQIIDAMRSLFDAVGWLGVVIAMTIESACIPLPSEIVMPLAGWLIVADRHLGWWGVVQAGFWGAVGNVIGSSIAYWVGAVGGRRLIYSHGRWILMSRKDVQRAEYFFSRWGEITALVSRLLPVVRTFISLPAGIAGMPFWRFIFYTFVGAFAWSVALAGIGYRLGPRWETFRENARFLDYPIALVIVLAVAWFIWHRVHELRAEGSH